jgi:hypothetical protein
MTTSVKHGNFTESERHISNEAYRRYLLDDENSIYEESGEFSRVNMVMGMLAKMYEEDGGPEKVQEFLKSTSRIEKSSNRRNHSGPGMAHRL